MEFLLGDLKRAEYLLKKDNVILFLFYIIVGLVTYSSFIVFELSNPDTIWNGIYYKSSWVWEAGRG